MNVKDFDEEIIRKAVFHTYNIDEDNINLRFNPSAFEKQRGGYRVRREFDSFTVTLNGGSLPVKEKLEKMGFGVRMAHGKDMDR